MKKKAPSGSKFFHLREEPEPHTHTKKQINSRPPLSPTKVLPFAVTSCWSKFFRLREAPYHTQTHCKTKDKVSSPPAVLSFAVTPCWSKFFRLRETPYHTQTHCKAREKVPRPPPPPAPGSVVICRNALLE